MKKCLFLLSIISCFFIQAGIVSANSAPIITTNGKVSQGIDIVNNVVHIKRTEYKVGVATTQVSDIDGGDIDFRITNTYDGYLFNMLNGKIRFIDAPRYDSPLDAQGNNAYNLQLLAIDAAGNRTYQRIRIVIERNQAPIITSFGISSQGTNVQQNIINIEKSELDSLYITTPVITDPEEDNFSNITLANELDSDLFLIEDGEIYFKQRPSIASGITMRSLVLEIQDEHGNTTKQQINITLVANNKENIITGARLNYPVVDQIHNNLLEQDACPSEWRNRSFQDRLRVTFQANYYEAYEYSAQYPIYDGQNEALYLHAHGLLGGVNESIDSFTEKTYEQIENRFYRYLYELSDDPEQRNISIEQVENLRDKEILISIDIEHELSPGKLGDYNYTEEQLRKYAEAYSKRIRVVRSYFPNAKITIYGTVIHGGNVYSDMSLGLNSRYTDRLSSLRKIGEYGAFDYLDYISPVLYVRKSAKDYGDNERKTFERYKGYISTVMQEAHKLEKSNGNKNCLAPVFGATIQNGASIDSNAEIPRAEIKKYLEWFMETYTGTDYLGPMNYWGERSFAFYKHIYTLRNSDDEYVDEDGNVVSREDAVSVDIREKIFELNNNIEYIIPNRNPYITTNGKEAQNNSDTSQDIVPITVKSGDTFIKTTQAEAIYGNTLSSFSVKESDINIENLVFDGTTLSFKNPIIHSEDNTYGNKYDITLEAIDNEGNATEQIIRVYVGRNNAPIIRTFAPSLISSQGIQSPLTTLHLRVPTGTRSITSTIAVNPQGETIDSLEILDGYDSDYVQLQDGHINFVNPPNISNPQDQTGNNAYNFVLQATGSDGNTTQQRLRVQVTDIQAADIHINRAKEQISNVSSIHNELMNQDACLSKWSGKTFQERTQVAFQGKYYDQDIAVGIQNNAMFIQGYALLVGSNYSFDEFILATKDDVYRYFQEYVYEDAQIQHLRNQEFLLFLDLEGPAHPSHIRTRLNLNDTQVQQYAQAYNMRVEVVRSFFPKAKISNYGVPIMNAASARRSDPYSYSYVTDVIDGLQTAATYGAFDSLDYLAPNMYVRNSPIDLRKALKQQAITGEEYLAYMEKYFNLSTEIALSITKSNGNSHCLAPTFLNIYVQGKDSPDYNTPIRKDFLRDYTQKYMDTYRDSPSMGPIIYWGRKSIEDYSASFNGANITEQMQYLNSNID